MALLQESLQLQELHSSHLPTFTADLTDGAVEIFGAGNSATDALTQLIASIPADGYIAIMAYLDL